MRFLVAIGVLAVSLGSAQAADPAWQELKPAGIGFRVELPDKADIKPQEVNGRMAYSAVVAIDKSVAGADLVFLVKYAASDKTPGPETEALLEQVVKTISDGNKLLSDKKETIGAFPARRFAIEDADKDTTEMRDVITDKYFIQLIFLGPAGNPLGKRFLDSLALAKP